MIALIQRVKAARVETAQDGVTGRIGAGLLLLLGVEKQDDAAKAQRLLDKVLHYRVFADEDGRMNRNVVEAGGSLLVVSQFTLAADTRKGRRPDFGTAAPPEQAEALYRLFCEQAAARLPTQTGRFGAEMQVHLQNDGPVTFWLQV